MNYVSKNNVENEGENKLFSSTDRTDVETIFLVLLLQTTPCQNVLMCVRCRATAAAASRAQESIAKMTNYARVATMRNYEKSCEKKTSISWTRLDTDVTDDAVRKRWHISLSIHPSIVLSRTETYRFFRVNTTDVDVTCCKITHSERSCKR